MKLLSHVRLFADPWTVAYQAPLSMGFSRGEDPLEEGVATHSSVLAWRLPRTEEPGGL